MLDRVELGGLTIEQWLERAIELGALRAHAVDQRAEILRIGTTHIRVLGELPHQLLPIAGIELPAVKRLQRELARNRARARSARAARARGERRSFLIVLAMRRAHRGAPFR